MKYRNILYCVSGIFILTTIFTLNYSGHNLISNADDHAIRGQYLGMPIPGKTAEIFAPGLVSTAYHEHSAVIFTPDGKEAYWSVFLYFFRPQIILHMKMMEDGSWSSPEVPSFSGQYSDGISCISPDGMTLYFESSRPIQKGGDAKDDTDLWYVERSGNLWGEPIHLGDKINSNTLDRGASVTRDGTLYFCSEREGGIGNSDLYRSQKINGVYQEPENLGRPVNSEKYERFPFIAPDESYLLYEIINADDSYGDGDIYISFRKKDRNWTKPVNLGKNVNSKSTDRFPVVTHDGKYIIFGSQRRVGNWYFDQPLTFKQIKKRLDGPGNGMGDIYWIDAGIIGDIKKSLNIE
jgi:hypothetical protein